MTMSDVGVTRVEAKGQAQMLRPFWQRVFGSALVFAVIAFILLGIVRLVGLLGDQFNLVVLGFVIMWFLPIIFFAKPGRESIGIKRPANWAWMLVVFVLGALAAGAITWVGYTLYGTGIANWGMASAREYFAQEEVRIPAVFAVVTLFSMLFSPIGEELFFRGIIHEVAARRLSSYKQAGFIGSLLFAAIHIPHHDIAVSGVGVGDMLPPLALWFLMMFLVSYLFMLARRLTGSIKGAILCHSGYVLGMNLFIYLVLLPTM